MGFRDLAVRGLGFLLVQDRRYSVFQHSYAVWHFRV